MAAALAGKPVLAFAGIGRPSKFFATLEACGIPVVVRKSFSDHHRYRASEIADLVRRAEKEALLLVTTEKDLARMRGDSVAADLVARTTAFPIALTIRHEAELSATLLASA